MKIKFAVIDDSQDDIDRLVREALKTREMAFEESFLSANEALASFRRKKRIIPVIFCDIRLYEENGLASGPELARRCKYLVFVTGHAGHKDQILAARGDDYLEKPVTCDEIRENVLNRFFKRYGDEIPIRIKLNKLYIYDGHIKDYYKEKLKNIKYITHADNYLDIANKDGKTYTVRATIAHAMSLLDPADIFVQVSKGTILNMKYLTKWDNVEAFIDERCFKLQGEGKRAFFDYIKRHKLGNGGQLD